MPRLLLALVALLVACGQEPAPASGEVRALDQAEILLSASPTPPSADALGWAPVALPDRWSQRRPGVGGFAWYRFETPGPVSSASEWGVFLPHVNMNAAVWVNGAPVGSGGRFTDPVARNFNRPLYFSFPSDLLSRPVNTIDVRFFSYAELGGDLGAVWMGEDRTLRPRFESMLWLRASGAQIATALCIAAVFLSGSLWAGSRGDPVYGWYALVTSLWTIVSLNYWVRDIPVSLWTWERAMHTALDIFVLALACWGHRYAGLVRPRLERVLAVAALTSVAIACLVPVSRFYPTVNIVHALLAPAAAYGAVIVLRHALRTRPVEAAIYVPVSAVALGLAAHDLLLQFGAMQPGAPYLLPYIMPLILVSFSATLVMHFVSALRGVEILNRELEQRVDEKRRELDHNYEARRLLERDKLVSEERDRLVREMHDGLGGQLVSVLSLAEADRSADPRVAAGVRAAIDDMRLVIDSLDPGLRTLAGALGAARARFEPAFLNNGVAFEWQAGDLPPTPWLGPQDYLNVLRIVQEALANVIRHAEATRAVVRSGVARAADGRLGIEISVLDDGRGIASGTSPRLGSRGLGHMRERAARLSGWLRIEAADEAPHAGTRVVLWIPGSAPAPGLGV